MGEKLSQDEENPNGEHAQKAWKEGVDGYIELIRRYEPLPQEVLENTNDTFRAMKFKIPPPLFQQCIVHATDICDKNAMYREAIEVLETAFKYDNNTVKNHRYLYISEFTLGYL